MTNTANTGIDSRADIHPSAKIGKNVTIGPWTQIREGAEIGDNTWIASNVVICENSKIGKNNRIFQFASLGEEPQHLGFKGVGTRLEMGDGNVIREYVSVSRGTEEAAGLTKIGNNNYIMAYSHLGHDCIVGDNAMLVNHATIAGHVTICDHAIIGAFTAIHQHVIIGEHSFVSRAALIGKDVLPYLLVCGQVAAAYGLNLVGLRRRGYSRETIKQLQQAYRTIYDHSIKQQDLIPLLQDMAATCPEVNLMIKGIERAKRGFIRKAREEELEE